MLLHSLAARPRARFEVDELARAGKDAWTLSAVAANQKDSGRGQNASTRSNRAETQRQLHLHGLGLWKARPLHDLTVSWDRRKRELQYLRDPLELALFVKQELRKGKAKEMLQLVRMASHSMQCIVSWNHVVDHLLAVGRVSEALKVYNEVRLVSAKQWSGAKMSLDEKTRTVSRFVHILDFATRALFECADFRRTRKGSINLPLVVCGELSG